MAHFARIGRLHRRRGDHRVDLLLVDAARKILIGAERRVLKRRVDRLPSPLLFSEERHRLVGVDRQNRLQVDGDDAERVQRGGQGRPRRLRVGFHRLPWLALVKILVRGVRKLADLDDDLVEPTVLIELRNRLARSAALLDERPALGVKRPELALELLLQHLSTARSDVRDLADKVGVDALDEVRQVEVHVVRRPAELRRIVVAERLRRQVVEVRARVHERALRLGHLLAVYRQEPVHEHLVGPLEAGRMQHPRPEQAVEANDVLADEVIEFNALVIPHRDINLCTFPFPLLAFCFREPIGERSDVPDRRIDPDVEELVGVAGNLETEVRRVARDAPAAERFLEPLEELIRDVARRVPGNPLLQIVVLRLKLEIEMLGVLHDRRAAARRADGVPELLRAVGRAAVIAAVAVLARRAALRTRPLHEAVGQEHLAVLAIELGRRLLGDETLLLRCRVDAFGELLVLRRIRRVVVVERNLEVGEVLQMHFVRTRDQLLRRDALLAGADHDGRAVRVVCADVDALMAAKLLETNPKVGLNVLDQVAEMDVTVRVRKRAGDDNSSLTHYGGNYIKNSCLCVRLWLRSMLQGNACGLRQSKAPRKTAALCCLESQGTFGFTRRNAQTPCWPEPSYARHRVS